VTSRAAEEDSPDPRGTFVATTALKGLIVKVATEEDYWQAQHNPLISYIINILCNFNPNYVTYIRNLLAEISNHTDINVRLLISKLITVMAIDILESDHDLEGYLQVLVTLASDPNRIVKNCVIAPLCELVCLTIEPQFLEKSKSLFATVLDGHRKTQREFLKCITKAIPKVSDTFRDQFILPELLKISAVIGTVKKASSKKKLLSSLISSYRAVNGCKIDDEIKLRLIIPALDGMMQHISALDIQDQKDLRELVIESKKISKKPEPVSASNWTNWFNTNKE